MMNQFKLLIMQAKSYLFLASILRSPLYVRQAKRCLELSKKQLALYKQDKTETYIYKDAA